MENRQSVSYLEEVTKSPESSEGPNGESDEEKDEFYDQAVAFVIDSRRASISAVQRKFRIGYNRAARLIETMESAGIVSEMNSNGNREVLSQKLNLIKSSIFVFLIFNSLNLISCDVSKIEKFLDENVEFQVLYEQNFSDSSDSIEGNIYRDYDNIKVFSLSPREELIINGNQILGTILKWIN